MSSVWSYSLAESLDDARTQLARLSAGRSTVVVSEETVVRHCLPRLGTVTADLVLPPGEEAKRPDRLLYLWEELTRRSLTRSDLMIAVGGGALLDIAGLAAATYRRGMRVVYLPTTLLADVDAAIGGKTAINVGPAKNGIGTFYAPEEVIICRDFLDTLPREELLSGWGEVVKYSLLDDYCLPDELIGTAEIPLSLLRRCIEYKIRVVTADPREERGLRQQLNLGHTIGHALEGYSMAQGQHIPHGIAVAAGLVVEGYLALRRDCLPEEELMRLARLVRDHFPPVTVRCGDYDALIRLSLEDKKRRDASDGIPVVLIDRQRQAPVVDLFERREVEEALDFYRDYMSI